MVPFANDVGAGDLDGDGVAVLLGLGDGAFAAAADGDGAEDLVLTHPGAGSVVVYRRRHR